MIFRTVIQDCLRLNWAVPHEALAALPEPLAYDLCRTEKGAFVFISALLFRQRSLGSSVHLPGVSHPQCQFQVCAVDGEGLECSWVFGTLLPSWLATGVRLAAGREARGARLEYPTLGTPGLEGGHWKWSVRRERSLEAKVRVASAAACQDPSLGSFEETLAYFRRQRSEFVMVRGRWQRVEVDRVPSQALPVSAEVDDDGLVTRQLPGATVELPALHSAWLVPTVETAFEYGGERERSPMPEAPAPL